MKPEVIFIGTSAGGVVALNKLFKTLPTTFSIPIIVVLHVGDNKFIPTAFQTSPQIIIKEADEKESILPGHIYFAPAGYHLLIEQDRTFSLSAEEKVQFARPSLDVTMESAAQVFGPSLVGIVLTGANEDGALGLSTIKKYKGVTVVQNPTEADYATMPKAALKLAHPEHILSLDDIGSFIVRLEKGEL